MPIEEDFDDMSDDDEVAECSGETSDTYIVTVVEKRQYEVSLGRKISKEMMKELMLDMLDYHDDLDYDVIDEERLEILEVTDVEEC